MGTVDVVLDASRSDTWPPMRPGGPIILQRRSTSGFARLACFNVSYSSSSLPTSNREPPTVHCSLYADGVRDKSLTDGIKLYERGNFGQLRVEELASGVVTHAMSTAMVDGRMCFQLNLCFSEFSHRGAEYTLHVRVQHEDWQCSGVSLPFKVHA
jgi:hypothetical protein